MQQKKLSKKLNQKLYGLTIFYQPQRKIEDKGKRQTNFKTMITKSYLREITYNVIGAAIEIHKSLGPGLLESVYHECMKHELHLRGISFSTEISMPVCYKEIVVATTLRCDLLIENCLAAEIKASKT